MASGLQTPASSLPSRLEATMVSGLKLLLAVSSWACGSTSLDLSFSQYGVFTLLPFGVPLGIELNHKRDLHI